MNHKTAKLFLIPAIFFAAFFGFSGEATAERFFQQNNTWYELIPDNPSITANFANYVADVLLDNSYFVASIGEWSIPIFYAAVDTSVITVPVSNPYQKAYIEANEWNKVPIPSGALPAGNAAKCAGSYRDGAMVVISYDRTTAWDFYGAKYCNSAWSASVIRKWDLRTAGVNSPYDGHGLLRAASTPYTQGIVTYNDILVRGEINHAMVFEYWADPKNPWPNGDYRYNSGVYPSAGLSRIGLSDRTWAMQLGMRLQLNPTFDCNTITNYPLEKMVCIALQTYGMIFVDSPGQGNEHFIQLEDLTNHPNKSWSGIYLGAFNDIPFNQMRVVEPIYPRLDTTPPAAPSGLTVQ